ncbi:Histone deacetylase 3 [Thoreauomyces humboldtii]|nr:Histone deacetylase 3 [Thoreauomyces humboldtii]
MSKRTHLQFQEDSRGDKTSKVPPNDAELTLRTVGQHSKQTVSYFFNEEASAFHYGEGHPMKPPRLALTHNLVVNYGLTKKMMCFRSRSASDEEITQFHSLDYIQLLRRISPHNVKQLQPWMPRHNLGVDDCPIFEGVYEFCQMYAGASLEAARKLIAGTTDIAINWSGGLHHAKKYEASGFCYVNDIVLSIQEMLREYARVVYVDIDVHHGDGVQEAFYRSNRVMTVSFHRYDGLFFPQTGDISERGIGIGKDYAINVPLTEYINDDSYAYIFRSVMEDVMKSFRPNAIVLQCGADSLANDRLGLFNLSIEGHGECVKFMKDYQLPMLVLGGGGYTIRNVARVWTYETSVLVDQELSNNLPDNKYYAHYGPDYLLHADIVDASAHDTNTRARLDEIREKVREHLRGVEHAPSVQMQVLPPGFEQFHVHGGWEADAHSDRYPDFRSDMGLFADISNEKEKQTEDDREWYDGDRDNDGEGGGENDEDVVVS